MWRKHEGEPLKINIKLHEYFTAESVLIVLRQSKNKKTQKQKWGCLSL